MSDSDLEKAIRAKIESDMQLKDAKLDVDANAEQKRGHYFGHGSLPRHADQSGRIGQECAIGTHSQR